MSGSNLGPVPTSLVFLSDLPRVPVGDKVRFLGCVAKYTVATAILTLHHNFPTLPAGSPTAAVDVNLLLSTLKSTDTQVGEWVNILGYVTSPPIYNSRTDRKPSSKASKRATVFVQAVMLWSAGSIHLGEYERTLKERKDVEKRMWLSL